MLNTYAITAIFVLGMALCTTASAHSREDAIFRLREDIKIQEARVNELENEARWDDETSKSLRAQAAASIRHFDWMRERSRDYEESAIRFSDDDPVRIELAGSSKEFNHYADHNDDFAQKREDMAKSLENQSRVARDAAQQHHETLEHLRTVLDHIEHREHWKHHEHDEDHDHRD